MLFLTIGIILFVVLQQSYRHSESQLNKQFSIAKLVFQDKLNNYSKTLSRSISPISKDFALKQLLNDKDNDQSSLLIALINYQKRAKADFSALLSRDGSTIVSNVMNPSAMWPIEDFRKAGVKIVMLNSRPYLVSAVPIRFVESSRRINAWLVMGIELQKLINDELKKVLGFDVTLVFDKAVKASTNNALSKEMVLAEVHQIIAKLSTETRQNISFRGAEYSLYQFSMNVVENEPITVFFTIDKDTAFVSFTTLASQLVIAIGIVMLITILLSFRISISIAKPLKRLVNVAQQIQSGDYTEITHNAPVTEVNKLSLALANMQSAVQQREKDNHQLAFYSTLTGLPNRNHFMDTMNKLISQENKRFAVIMMDIDRFKDINDTLGHEYGDQVLKVVATKLQAVINGDGYVAYLDGDEFAVIVPFEDVPNVKAIVAPVKDVFEQVFLINNIQLDISTSMGVALYPDHAIEADGLMQLADIALYVCKENHYSYQVYDEKFNTHSILRLSLMSELRSALTNGQMELHFQPQIEISSKRVKSLECLVRWQHPEHGFIFPDEFIPLAEQTGNIRYLTRWAIEEALKQYKLLKENGFDIHMAVNMSAVDLVDSKLVAYVQEALDKYEVAPKSLMLEVTESAIMSDPEKAIAALAKLKQMGIQLSIDDFGTGYSSMEQLKRTPVNELKIDKSFVLELTGNTEDVIIVKSITDLAHNLGLTVVAEGVENIESLDVLAEMGVETAQGYYINKAMHSDDFLPWLVNYEKNNH